MISLAVPNLTGREKEYLDNCIDTTFVSSVGEYVNQFERMVADATGSQYAVATSSGTTGIHAALTAIGVKPGELVIIPSFTFIASANAVSHCGALPWLIDIKATDWCLDPELVKEEINKNCKCTKEGLVHNPTGKRVAALMPVYTLGNIPDMEAFRVIADEYNIPLVVDAACAIGAEYKNMPFGSLADLSILSFNGNKTITCGGGGAVVGNNKELINLVRHLTTTARVGTEYDFDMVGFNYRMTNIQAAVGCAQMERLEEFVTNKRKVRKFYGERLKQNKVSFFPTTDGSSCWFSGVVLPEGQTIDNVRQFCNKLRERGIEARTFWKPIHLQKPYQLAPRGNLQISGALWERILTLPCSTNITDEQLNVVVNAVKEVVLNEAVEAFL